MSRKYKMANPEGVYFVSFADAKIVIYGYSYVGVQTIFNGGSCSEGTVFTCSISARSTNSTSNVQSINSHIRGFNKFTKTKERR